MAIQWYAAIDGDQKGPLTLSELQGWAWQGRIDQETFVKENASGEWVSAGTIAALFPDGNHPAREGRFVPLEPSPETYAVEWQDHRFETISALLAVLCLVAGLVVALIFMILSCTAWTAALTMLTGVLAWSGPGILLGAIVGYFRRAGTVGAMLGALFGPLGVIAALAADNRPYCSRCFGRLEGLAEVCPHCHAALCSADSGEEEPSSDESQEVRTWTDARGQYTMEGRFVRRLGDAVTLRHEDGSVVDVPMDRLSEQDRQWIHTAEGGKRAGGVAEAILISE